MLNEQFVNEWKYAQNLEDFRDTNHKPRPLSLFNDQYFLHEN